MQRAVTTEEFWGRIDKSSGPEGCWPWMGCKSVYGYGVVGWRGRQRGAHRVAFALSTGAWPKGLACHSCDNRPCCNPAHIFDGTISDNQADMARKERGIKKLTGNQVRKIRAIEGRTYTSIAEEYGVSLQTISAIINMKLRQYV